MCSSHANAHSEDYVHATTRFVMHDLPVAGRRSRRYGGKHLYHGRLRRRKQHPRLEHQRFFPSHAGKNGPHLYLRSVYQPGKVAGRQGCNVRARRQSARCALQGGAHLGGDDPLFRQRTAHRPWAAAGGERPQPLGAAGGQSRLAGGHHASQRKDRGAARHPATGPAERHVDQSGMAGPAGSGGPHGLGQPASGADSVPRP